MFYTIGTDGASKVKIISSFETKTDRGNYVAKNPNHASVKRAEISKVDFSRFESLKRLYAGGRRVAAID